MVHRPRAAGGLSIVPIIVKVQEVFRCIPGLFASLAASGKTPPDLSPVAGGGDLRDLKTPIQRDVLRCEMVAGVSKELVAYALVNNLIRRVMVVASRRQGVPVD